MFVKELDPEPKFGFTPPLSRPKENLWLRNTVMLQYMYCIVFSESRSETLPM